MISVFFEIDNPTINLIKMEQDSECISLNILNIGEDSLQLHFNNREDLDNFLGIMALSREALHKS